MITNNIRKILNEKCLKITALSLKAGYKKNTLSNMLNGRKTITADDVLILSDLLGVTPNQLLGYEDLPKFNL